jgi:competence protein ComEC
VIASFTMAFFLSFLSGVIVFYLSQYFLFTAILIFAVSLLFLILKKKYLLIPVIAFGIFYAFFRYGTEQDFSFTRGKELLVSGVFDSEPVITSSGNFMQGFHVDSAMDTDTGESLEELDDAVIKIISNSKFDIGSKYELIIEAGKDKTRFNPGRIKSNDFYAYLKEINNLRGDTESIWMAFQRARARLNSHITESFAPDSAAFISSITTGQRGGISEELRDAFNATGLVHILSVSGTHFGLFSVFLFGIFRTLIKLLPYRILQRITIYITPSQGAAILCLPFMIAYLGLSGASIPAIRSFIMVSLFLIGLLIGRKDFWLNSLLFAAFVIVLWEPATLFNLSFQLSFLAVLFIGFSVGYMEDKKGPEGQKSRDAEDKRLLSFLTSGLHIFRASLLLTLAASLGTAPLVAYHFHYFSIISPISNLFITPLIGFVLLPLSIFSAFIFLLTGHYVFDPLTRVVSDLTVYLVMNIGGLSFADAKIPAFPAILVILFYAGFIFYILSGKKKYGLTLPLIPIIIYLSIAVFSKRPDINVTYLDVGQGDSAVVETSEGKTMVIDTGNTGKELEAYLRYRGKKTVDALIVTHADNDHSGGMQRAIKRFDVKEVWDNGLLIYPDDLLKNVMHRSLKRGDEITVEDIKIIVLHPYKGFYTFAKNESTDRNNYSLVVKITGKKSFLFTGDVGEEAEEDMAHLGRWLKSDVIKVPHHGGRTSTNQTFFDEVSPEIAVISVGRDNPYGHPHIETLERLSEAMDNPPIPPLAKGGEGGFVSDAKIYRTDRDGAIKITERGDHLEAKIYKDFQFEKTRSFTGEVENIKRLFVVW